MLQVSAVTSSSCLISANKPDVLVSKVLVQLTQLVTASNYMIVTGVVQYILLPELLNLELCVILPFDWAGS